MTLGNIYDNFFWKKWLKVKNLKYALSSLRQLLATTESPSKMMKIAFYFILKAFLVLKIFKICLEFLVMSKNGLIRKMMLISKFMTSQLG